MINPKFLDPLVCTSINLQHLNKSDVLVENMQIHEYLTDIPQVGRRDYRIYPPRYADPYYIPPPLGDPRQNGSGIEGGRGGRRPANADPDDVCAARRWYMMPLAQTEEAE